MASGGVSIPTSASAPADETTIDADGLWVIPGLWDCHTHFTQWAKTLGRLDLINARSAAEAMDMLRRHLDERRAADTLDPDAFVVGMRFRHSLWADDEQPTLAAIDAVTGEQPVAPLQRGHALRMGEFRRGPQAWRTCGRIRSGR